MITRAGSERISKRLQHDLRALEILNVLETAGHVHGADIVDYGWRPGTALRDCLTESVEMNGVGIVTNPPYKLAAEFVAKAIADGCTFHAWLLRTNFLESSSRKALFEQHPPARIWILAMMHRAGWTGKRSGSNVAYAWFVWDSTAPSGPMEGWFNWRDHSAEAAK